MFNPLLFENGFPRTSRGEVWDKGKTFNVRLPLGYPFLREPSNIWWLTEVVRRIRSYGRWLSFWLLAQFSITRKKTFRWPKQRIRGSGMASGLLQEESGPTASSVFLFSFLSTSSTFEFSFGERTWFFLPWFKNVYFCSSLPCRIYRKKVYDADDVGQRNVFLFGVLGKGNRPKQLPDLTWYFVFVLPTQLVCGSGLPL